MAVSDVAPRNIHNLWRTYPPIDASRRAAQLQWCATEYFLGRHFASMKFATPLARGRLVSRYKRFFADVVLEDGAAVTAHCPNPGAMLGLNTPGLPVWLSKSDDPKRKLAHTLEIVEVDGG